MSARNCLATLLTAVLFSVNPFAHASTVLVLLTPDGAVVAADSQVNRSETDSRRRGCKVTIAAPHVVFAAVGVG